MHEKHDSFIKWAIDNSVNVDHLVVGKYPVLRDIARDFINSYKGDVNFIYKIMGLSSYTDKQYAAALRIMIGEAKNPQPSPSPVATPHVMRTVNEGRYTVLLDPVTDLQYTLWITKYDGYYTVPPGTLSVKLLTGPDNTRNYSPCAFIYPDNRVQFSKKYRENENLKCALHVLMYADDPIKFGEAYALKTSKCWRCHLPLTRAKSIIRGLGPICAKNLGLNV